MRLIVVIFLLVSFAGSSQTWTSLNGSASFGNIKSLFVDTVENKLYAVGTFQSIGGIPAHRVAYWDGNTWTSQCNPPFVADANPINSVLKKDGELYVSGSHYAMQDSITGRLAHYVNGEWESFGNPVGYARLKDLNDTIYAFGYFDSIGDKPIKNIAWLNGGLWEPISDTSTFNQINISGISDIEYYNGNMILAGNFNSYPFKEIIQWDGSSWSQVGQGIPNDTWVNSIEVFNDLLFIGGYFDEPGYGKSLTLWDGDQFHEPFPDLEWIQVWDMKIINNELYIVGPVGLSSNPSVLYGLAKFDGDSICLFGGAGTNWSSIGATSIVEYNGDLIVTSGMSMLSDTVNYAAVWNGNSMDTCITASVYAGINELNMFLYSNKTLVKIIDLMGRETKDSHNTPLIYIYSDGSRRKVYNVVH